MIGSTINSVKNNFKKYIYISKNEFHYWYVDATRIVNEMGSKTSLPRTCIAGRQIYHANALADGATTEG